MPNTVAEILLDRTLDKPLDYAIPKSIEKVEVGMRVEVPLRGGKAQGTIAALKKSSAFEGLKPFLRLLHDESLVSSELFQLASWISTYYSCPLSRVLKAILPPSVRKEGSHKMQGWIQPLLSRGQLAETCETIRGRSPAQAKVLDLLLKHPKGILTSRLAEKAGVTRSPIKALIEKKILTEREVRVDRSPIFDHDFFPIKPKVLTDEQKKTCDAILQTLGSFQPHLIHGVTGSGKTEVYLRLIQEALDKKEGVLYLVPEISLTSQTIERFKGRFKEVKIAILHHRLSDGEKFDTWHNIRKGEIPIVIGARSALFSPFPKLGLIIVDEEHEATYKQSDEAPKYHARDMAIVRAKLAGCPVVLGSATPSIESYTNALEGKYALHILKERPQSATLPKVEIIDMKTEFEKAGGFTLFSQALLKGIEMRLARGEQALLFLNRRGYHTSANCPFCAHAIACPHCDLNLTYHKGEQILACHLCDYQIPTLRQCPSCSADGPLKFKGAGTQLIQKTLHALFPDIRTLRLDADTTRHKGSHEKIYKEFKSGKADVLIGTQMIAKGLHFPMVTLAGILNLDGSLNIPDFRASEVVFQLLTQVAGRAGRGEISGKVLIQTQIPHHPIIRQGAAQNYRAFYEEEIEVRKLFDFPPYVHLIKCGASGSGVEAVEKLAIQFREMLLKALPKEAEILPVIPCGYAKIAGRHRFQFLIKTRRIFKTIQVVTAAKKQLKQKGDLRLSIDVDPLSTFF